METPYKKAIRQWRGSFYTLFRRCSEGEKVATVSNTYKEAKRLPEAVRWKAASDKEVRSLEDDDVYTLVPITTIPPGNKLVGSRWVQKVKADNTFKGRVVVQGRGQGPGIDCGSILAPVCRIQYIRLVLAEAEDLDWDIWLLDVQMAFLNDTVRDEVGVKMASRYEEKNTATGVSFMMIF